MPSPRVEAQDQVLMHMNTDYVEAFPLPVCCEKCNDYDCYECEHASERWLISTRRELELKKKLKEKAIARFQREIAEIDRQLANFSEGSDNDGIQC